MIKDIQFPCGTKFKDACKKMYDDVLISEVPESTNFNGVRILMFYDGGKAESRKGKLDLIKKLCENCTAFDESISEQILDIVGYKS